MKINIESSPLETWIRIRFLEINGSPSLELKHALAQSHRYKQIPSKYSKLPKPEQKIKNVQNLLLRIKKVYFTKLNHLYIFCSNYQKVSKT